MALRDLLPNAREAARIARAVVAERYRTGLLFNPLFGKARRDPYPMYRRLRERDPVHRSYVIKGWVLTRHADCVELLRDTRFSADDRHYVDHPRMHASAIRSGLVDPDAPQEPVMLRRDPPDHTRLRGLVNKAFTPRAVEKLRPRIETLADELLAGLAARGSCDLIADFAVPLPVTIIAEMLGIPAKDRELFKRWSDHLVGFLDPQASPGAAVLRRTVEEFFEYLTRIIEERRSKPADDLLSALVLAEEEGDRLSAGELLGTVALLLAAGNETTTNLIGNGALALLRNPEQLDRLRAEPDLMPAAVEELLRWDSPVQLTMRIPTEDLEFAGARFRRGQGIIAVLAAANRDPDVFDAPERLDIGREDNRHLSFGQGVHFCLGAQLARLEADVAFAGLLRHFPDLRLASTQVTWRRFTFLRGLEKLLVEV